AGLGLAATLLGGLIVYAPGRIGDTLSRFDEIENNPRYYIWEDSVYAAWRYWPIGAGTGTFDEVFQIDESLENMTQRRAGRAHNDYLEIAVEFGLPGLILVAAWIGLLAWLSWRARTSKLRWGAWAGSCFLFAIALQSITDYPLRNQAILAFAGFALLVLVRLGASEPDERRQ
ncbi:MAG: O-antigen ligase family protein, partial [Hoeflea sp.]